MTFLPEYISVPSLSLTNKSTWIYLADWILALILGLAFIFYFNRLVGFIVSKILQLVLWKYHKVEINIESCRISFLGGRFFAKNLVIINSNETISILHLNFTWRYWIFKPTRLAEYFVDKSGDDDSRNSKENSHYPTRFTLLIEGLEHFMYNRIVAYDNIMDFLNKEDNAPINVTEKTEFEDGGIRRRTTTKSSSSASEKEDIRGEHEEIDNSTTPTDSSLHTPQPLEGAAESNSSSMLKTLLRLFPVSVKIKKGALIIGNPSTPTLIVASFQTADTIVDIANSPSPLDLYRQVFNFQFENLKVSLKPNLTYREKQTTEKKQNGGVGVNLKLRKKYKIWFKFRKSIDVFFNTAVRKFTRNRFGKNYHEQNEDDHLKNWRGLRRYVGDASDDQNTPGFDANEEYAKYSLILDSTSTRLIYYYDVPGLVSALSSVKQPAPEFGIYIELSVTTIHYGPWADKQRIPLQSLLFPTLNRDTRPTEIPLPGMTRNYKGFDLFIEVKDEVIFRIPTREQSKDLAIIKNFQQQQQAKHNNQHLHHHHHHSDKNQNVKSDPDDQVLEQSSSRSGPTRSFGWLELKIKPGSNLASHTSYIATKEDGWPNSLSLNFIGPELRSSVNHDLFFQADSHNISAKVGFPLGWNEKCNWEFQNISKNAEIFF